MTRFYRRIFIILFVLLTVPFAIPIVAIITMIRAMHFEELWAVIKEEWNK